MKIIALQAPRKSATLLARVVTNYRAGLLPSADGSCVSTSPSGPAAIANGLLSLTSAPVFENQHHRSTSAAFRRDLELAALSRRKRRGKWRQRCAL